MIINSVDANAANIKDFPLAMKYITEKIGKTK